MFLVLINMSWFKQKSRRIPDSLLQLTESSNDDDMLLATCDGCVHVLPRLIVAAGQHVHNAVRLAALKINNEVK